MQTEFQEKQLKKLQESKTFGEASIYTVVLALVRDSDVEEVFMMLHNVATTEGKREDLEKRFGAARTWGWKTY